ncbi:MAG: 16S rRNA (cytosine(967)-C(5))-methyltransferase RsmB, partial [Ruminococcus sp.]|nr:16S rRNA (cytosine(967)-C(5))-methyltransferase RsmB [Ruminococcus sp.]
MGNSRKVVLKLLTKIDKNSSYSNILLDDGLAKSNLSLQDKKFAAALFYGVLERRITLDAVIKKYSKRPSDKLNAEILNLLRMGIYQLCYMDSVPDSAAVDECVKLAKCNRNPAVSGFVNGLLRSFIRDNKDIPKGTNKIESLSIEYSCPEWLVKKWSNEYGDNATLSMLKTSLGQAPTTIRVNTTKCSTDILREELSSGGIGCDFNQNTLNAINIFSSGSVESIEQYKRGLFHVQDISSQLCCAVVDPKEDDTILDICSAPGGKTFTLAEMINNKGKVFAFDLHENRVKLIRQGSARLGLSCVSADINNGKVFSELLPMADRVLCDVP